MREDVHIARAWDAIAAMGIHPNIARNTKIKVVHKSDWGRDEVIEIGVALVGEMQLAVPITDTTIAHRALARFGLKMPESELLSDLCKALLYALQRKHRSPERRLG